MPDTNHVISRLADNIGANRTVLALSTARPSLPGGPGPAASLTGNVAKGEADFGDSQMLTQQQIADLIAYVMHLNGVEEQLGGTWRRDPYPQTVPFTH